MVIRRARRNLVGSCIDNGGLAQKQSDLYAAHELVLLREAANQGIFAGVW